MLGGEHALAEAVDADTHFGAHDLHAESFFGVDDRVSGHDLDEAGEERLLDAGLDLREVEAVLASAVVFDHHEVEEVEDGLRAGEVRFDEAVEEDRQDVFGAGRRLEAQDDVEEVCDGDDGLLDALDDEVHAAAFVDALELAHDLVQVLRHVLDASVLVFFLDEVVELHEGERAAAHEEAEVFHGRVLGNHVQEDPTGDQVEDALLDQPRELVGEADGVRGEAAAFVLEDDLPLELGESRVRV